MTKTKVIELLTPEKGRIYTYPQGNRSFIEGATYLNHLDDGSHLIRHPSKKDKILVPAGWSTIDVVMKEPKGIV